MNGYETPFGWVARMAGPGKPELPAGIYGITAEEHSRGRTNLEVVRAMIAGGIKILQYREKGSCKSQRQMLEECRLIRSLTRDAGVLFIVNDRADLALLAEADGVHLGQDDLPLPEVRKLVGHDRIIGLSTHSPQQAQLALADGADYIGVGPIFPTQTKKDVCESVGLAYLDYVARHIPIPFVAIGGIKTYHLPELAGHGAKTVCMVTEIVGAEDIAAKVRELSTLLRPEK